MGREAHHEGIVSPDCVPITALGVYSLAAPCRPTPATLYRSFGCEIRAKTFRGNGKRGEARHFGRAFFFIAPLHATIEEFVAEGSTHVEEVAVRNGHMRAALGS